MPQRHRAPTSFDYTEYLGINAEGFLVMTKLARLFHNADDVVDAWRDALRHRDVKGALDIWLDDASITCVLPKDIA